MVLAVTDCLQKAYSELAYYLTVCLPKVYPAKVCLLTACCYSASAPAEMVSLPAVMALQMAVMALQMAEMALLLVLKASEPKACWLTKVSGSKAFCLLD